MGGVFGKDKKQAQAQMQQKKMPVKQCTETTHYGKIQQCAKKNCTAEVCPNCRQPSASDGKFYCMLCQMAIDSDLQFDQEKEDEMIRKSKSTRPFEQTVSVKIDAKTGTIVGWDSLFRLIEAEEAAKLKNKSAQDGWSKVGDKLLKKVRPGDYTITPVGVNNDKFIIEHRRENTRFEI